MTDAIISVLLVLAIGAAVYCIIKSKKNGVKCIGCPSGCNCSGANREGSGCNCGGDCSCHTE